ncbi:hypothetical protein SALBM135S_06453 [Streptomyces alboniger]
MAAVDLLAGHAVRHVGERDEPQVARGQHDRLGAAGGPPLVGALLHRPAQGRAHGGTGLGAAVRALRPARHGQTAAGPDEVAEGEAVAGLEGLAGALAVVGEDHDPVGARRVLGHLLQEREGAVEPPQDLVDIPAARPGVVRHLVVRDEVGVDRAAPREHVPEDGGDHHVTLDDGREGADQRVEPAPADTGAAPLDAGAQGLADLAEDLGDEGEGGPHGVGGIGEVGEVPGPRSVLLPPPGGHGEDEGELLGAAAEEVAAAGAVDGEEAAVAGALDGAALELGGGGRPVADHDLAGVLLVPPERGHVVVGAVQDAELARPGLAGPVRAPGGEAVGGGDAALPEPPPESGHQPFDDGGAEHVVPDPVELDEDEARVAGLRSRQLAAAASAVGEAVEAAAVGVVVTDGERAAGGRGDGGHHRGDDHGGLRPRLAPPLGDEAQGEQQQRAVEEEGEQAEHEGGHEQQGAHQQRPHERGEQTEGAGAEGRGDRDAGGAVAAVGLELEVRQDSGEHEHRQGADRPYGDHAPHGAAGLPPSPHAATPPARTGLHPATPRRGPSRRRPRTLSGRRIPRWAWRAAGAPAPSSARRTPARPGPPSRPGRPGARTPR